MENITQVVLEYVPNIIGAGLILIIGWIIAAIVAGIIGGLLRRVRLDERVGRAMADTDGGKPPRTTLWISRTVFWLIILVAIVGALQALNLTLIITPFNELLNTLFNFLPRLAAAAVLILVAWLVATVLRFGTRRALAAVNFDERVANERAAQTQVHRPALTDASASEAARAEQPVSPAQETRLSETLATTVYWLTFLLFLPAILGALGLESLLAPVQQLLTEILLFLPRLLAAGVILLVGWFIATIVRRITATAAAGLGADSLSDRVGLSDVLGPRNLSGLLGLVVYVLILVPVAIAALNALQIPAVTAPASAMLASFLNALPAIFAAIALVGLAFIVGRVVARLVSELLASLGFNTWLERMRVWTPRQAAEAQQVPGQPTTPADVVGIIVLVGIVLLASIAALNLLGLILVADLVTEFMVLAGQIILGLLIFAIGLVLSNLAARAIVRTQLAQRGLLALAARISILVLAGAMALRQMGLANEIVNLAFGLLLGALAIAFALAFGLGGREPAQREVERFFEGLRSGRIDTAAAAENRRIEARQRGAEGTAD